MRFGTTFVALILSTVMVSPAALGTPTPTLAMRSAAEPAPSVVEPASAVQPTIAFPASVPAPAPVVAEPAAEAASLAPGEYVWHPERVNDRFRRHRRQHSAAAGLHLSRRDADRDDHGLHRTTRQRDAHRPLPDPREAPRALFEPVQQCADAVHAAPDLGRRRPACRPHSRSPGVAWLRPASARLRAPAVHGNAASARTVHIIDASPSAEIALAVARGELGRGTVTTLAMTGDVRRTIVGPLSGR